MSAEPKPLITRPGYLWCSECQQWVSEPRVEYSTSESVGECPECGDETLSEEGEEE